MNICTHTHTQSPSIYCGFRRRALEHTLQCVSSTLRNPEPTYIFGDFNFRLDFVAVVKVRPHSWSELIPDHTPVVSGSELIPRPHTPVLSGTSSLIFTPSQPSPPCLPPCPPFSAPCDNKPSHTTHKNRPWHGGQGGLQEL